MVTLPTNTAILRKSAPNVIDVRRGQGTFLGHAANRAAKLSVHLFLQALVVSYIPKTSQQSMRFQNCCNVYLVSSLVVLLRKLSVKAKCYLLCCQPERHDTFLGHAVFDKP